MFSVESREAKGLDNIDINLFSHTANGIFPGCCGMFVVKLVQPLQMSTAVTMGPFISINACVFKSDL